MSETQEQVQPERPPMTGRGSSVDAWREYAAAVTDSPVESWQALSRDEIVELLDAEGAEQSGGNAESQGEPGDGDQVLTEVGGAPRLRGPQWMVPADEGPVPEPVLRQQVRAERLAKARAAREAKAKGDRVSSSDVAALNPTGGE